MLNTTWRIRPAAPQDQSFLREMLYEAVCWRPNETRAPIEELLSEPELAKLLAGWGRKGDTAFVAELEDGTSVGAAWYRFWTNDDHSFGFVDEATPELGIAVLGKVRKQGIGTALLKALLDHARHSRISRMSLSVEPENFSRLIYEKLGFRKVGMSGTSWTMLLEFDNRP